MHRHSFDPSLHTIIKLIVGSSWTQFPYYPTWVYGIVNIRRFYVTNKNKLV